MTSQRGAVDVRRETRDALTAAASDSARRLLDLVPDSPAPNAADVDALRARVAGRARTYAAVLRKFGVREQEVAAELTKVVSAAVPPVPEAADPRDEILRWCVEACAEPGPRGRTPI